MTFDVLAIDGKISAVEQPDRYYLALRVMSPLAATADVTISAVHVGAT